MDQVFLSNSSNFQTDLFDPKIGVLEILSFQARSDQELITVKDSISHRAGASPLDAYLEQSIWDAVGIF